MVEYSGLSFDVAILTIRRRGRLFLLLCGRFGGRWFIMHRVETSLVTGNLDSVPLRSQDENDIVFTVVTVGAHSQQG